MASCGSCMPEFCCQPQLVSEDPEETPGNGRVTGTLILALAQTTGQDHLTSLYRTCC